MLLVLIFLLSLAVSRGRCQGQEFETLKQELILQLMEFSNNLDEKETSFNEKLNETETSFNNEMKALRQNLHKEANISVEKFNELLYYANNINSRITKLQNNLKNEARTSASKFADLFGVAETFGGRITELQNKINDLTSKVQLNSQLGLGTWRNVALGKPATQSSTYSSWAASKAVDGDAVTNYHEGSCSHTLDKAVNWLRVDLQDQFWVGSVKITNRRDSYHLANFTVYVDAALTRPGEGRRCVHVATIARGATVEYPCQAGTDVGRYVTVVLLNNFLAICEFQVIGKPV